MGGWRMVRWEEDGVGGRMAEVEDGEVEDVRGCGEVEDGEVGGW